MPADTERRPRSRDIARAAGVSAATVLKPLRGVAPVTPANAQRIHDAAAEIVCRKDPLASGPCDAQRRNIGTVVPDIESPFFGAPNAALERAAETAGDRMIIAVAQPVAMMAKPAVVALRARVEGQATGFPAQYLAPCAMMIRGSARPAKRPSRPCLNGV